MYSRRPGAAGDFELALEILADRGDALRGLLTHTFSLSDAQRAFETACDKSRGALKVTLAPELAP
jgi:threonine dehydrogenase-like Zn-dependent dehydrogenase